MKTYIIRAIIFAVLSSAPLSFSWGNSEFEQWFQKEMDQYTAYQEERDREFSQFLKSEWQEYTIDQGVMRDTTPKPVDIPVAPIQILPTPQKPIPISIKPPRPPIIIPLPPILLPKTEPKGTKLSFDFYGVPLKVGYDASIKNRLPSKIDSKTIADFWDKLSQADFKTLLTQLEVHRDQLTLNDWGYAQLIYVVGKTIYNQRENEASLFTWFMLSKSGYLSRVGYSSQYVFLLLPSKHEIFNTSYFTYDQRKFYVTALDGDTKNINTLFTYKGHYPGTDRLIDLSLNQLPSLNTNHISKALKFSYKGQDHSINVKYDGGLIDYLNNYPITELEIYFSSTVSATLSQTLLSSLKPIIEGKSETEAVNILLRFVQTAFDYKTDKEQFGREKYFFSEELFFYKYSDCEDRAVLFSYLIKNLLGLEIIGIDYPGHVATAVQLSNPSPGQSVIYKKKKYTIADPTYINAKVGMVMPRYKKENPGIIPIRSL